MNSKIKTYLGFCKKSGKLVIGFNEIEKRTKKIYLIIIEKATGENTFKKIVKKAQEKSCPLLICNASLTEYVCEECKTVAIGNKSLADAITENIDGDFSLYQGGLIDG